MISSFHLRCLPLKIGYFCFILGVLVALSFSNIRYFASLSHMSKCGMYMYSRLYENSTRKGIMPKTKTTSDLVVICTPSRVKNLISLYVHISMCTFRYMYVCCCNYVRSPALRFHVCAPFRIAQTSNKMYRHVCIHIYKCKSSVKTQCLNEGHTNSTQHILNRVITILYCAIVSDWKCQHLRKRNLKIRLNAQKNYARYCF